MCDFFSCCIRVDGAVVHLADNSHAEAVAAAGWKENDQLADLHGPRFVEAEWNGSGYPGAVKICRGPVRPNDKQVETCDRIYGALARLLSDPEANAEAMLFGQGIFAGDEYADVRWRVLISEKCPKRVADKLVALPLYANAEPIKSLDPRITELAGNLVIAEGGRVSAKSLRTISGYVYISAGAKADFPVLAKVGRNVYVSGGATVDFPALTEVGGNVVVSGSASFPALAEAGGYVYVSGGASFPVLAKVGGNVEVSGSASFPALAEAGGNVVVYGGATADFPVLAKAGGDVVVSGGAKADFPVLAKAGGYVEVSGSANADFPALETVNGKPHKPAKK